MERVTLKWLGQQDNSQIYKFIIRNKLEGFPVDRFNEVHGDLIGFGCWVREQLRCEYMYDSNGYVYDDPNNMINIHSNGDIFRCEYDKNGNRTKIISPNGYTLKWDYEYYNSGQLKSIHEYGEPIIAIPEI